MVLINHNTTMVHNITSTLSSLHNLITDVSKLTKNEMEHHISLKFFFILAVVGLCILVVHLLITTKIHYLPESIAIVFIGASIGLFLKMIGNWRQEEEFPPMIFFLVFLPPIIFESGYNLHKGNFFQNLGSILVFAIIGTTISAIVIGGGLYLCGIANLAYKLTIFESFGFGSLISAVDPVATLAIFKALDVDPILYMLVFGESILNDAVSIVLMTTIMNLDQPEKQNQSALTLVGQAIGSFLATFLASAAIGIIFGLISALVLKWFDLRKTPSLEVAMMLVFSYAPYCLCEGIELSGIMAILFAGIVMSHYTHRNLSPVTQMTVQQIFRTMAFMAETIVFAYLGLAIFSFQHRTEPAFISWVLVLCLMGRAANIFPLSFLLNYFREIKITRRNQFVMWFSGLRGAIAFALALHLDNVSKTTQQVLVTTALIVVLFTIICLGGLTLPVIKLINWFTKCIDNDDSDDEDQCDDDEAVDAGSPIQDTVHNRVNTSSSDEDTIYLINDKSHKISSKSTRKSHNSSTGLLRKRKRHHHSSRSGRYSSINRVLGSGAIGLGGLSSITGNPSPDLFISKTKEMGDAVDSEMSGFYDTEAEYYQTSRHKKSNVRRRRRVDYTPIADQGDGIVDSSITVEPESVTGVVREAAPSLRGFMRLDAKYLFPFFTRCHTQKDVQEAHRSMNHMTEQWQRVVRTQDNEPATVIELVHTTSLANPPVMSADQSRSELPDPNRPEVIPGDSSNRSVFNGSSEPF